MWLTAFLFMLFAYNAHCDNHTIDAWNECTKILREVGKIRPETIELAEVLNHCHYIRTGIARCLVEKQKPEFDDGSSASRGKCLVDMIKKMDRNEDVVQIARHYHYACVYNDIGIWLRNESCYYHMVQTCVLRDGDCYNLSCCSEDDSEKSDAHLSTWYHFYTVTFILLSILY